MAKTTVTSDLHRRAIVREFDVEGAEPHYQWGNKDTTPFAPLHGRVSVTVSSFPGGLGEKLDAGEVSDIDIDVKVTIWGPKLKKDGTHSKIEGQEMWYGVRSKRLPEWVTPILDDVLRSLNVADPTELEGTEPTDGQIAANTAVEAVNRSTSAAAVTYGPIDKAAILRRPPVDEL